MFQKVKSILYRVLFLILFFVLAKSCASDYFNGADEVKVSQYEQMLSDDSFVYANLDEHYTQTRVAKVIYTYTFDYTFDLDEKAYSGKITISEIPNVPVLKLFYLKSDPNIVSYNPQKSIESEKEKGALSDLLVGIIWVILAILTLLSLISEIRKASQKQVKTATTETE